MKTNYTKEKCGDYSFIVMETPVSEKYKWFYTIYDTCKEVIHRNKNHEYFDTEQQARYAAIGHITLLENQEG